MPDTIPFPTEQDNRPSRYFKCSVDMNKKTIEPCVIMNANCSYTYSDDKKTCYVNAKGTNDVPTEYTEITLEQHNLRS